MAAHDIIMAAAGASGPATYIEDVFSTWLYTGNNTSQTITNGIDLAGKGGLVWIKSRAGTYVRENYLYDTARGTILSLSTDTTGANVNNSPNGVSAYNANGFTIVGSAGSGGNGTGTTYASWTFRKQPKFFDVVTFTSNSTGGATINHSLGSAPGCVIVKSTGVAGSWFVYHIGMDPAEYMFLNTTAAAANGGRTVTTSSTQVTYPSGYLANSTAYVAYLFASDAGGFGLTGTDNVISCGVYTGNGAVAGPIASFGFEPQWVLVKKADGVANWFLADNLRGMDQISDQMLLPNNSGAEFTSTGYVKPLATGFQIGSVDFDVNEAGMRYIYIAIRRGPMKTPTTGTSVFVPTAYTGNGGSTTITAGFPVDLSMFRIRTAATGQTLVNDRLRGVQQRLFTDVTTAESQSVSAVTSLASNTAVTVGANGDTNSSGLTYVSWMFRRAPSFFDEVCYTGTGATRTVAHNLGVAPELMIVKSRNVAVNWAVYSSATGANAYLVLNSTAAVTSGGPGSTYWGSTNPTSSVFTVGSAGPTNNTSNNYVAYLFASCPGVSKVGSYTGTGATQTISCGFAARFVLIKRTNSTGDWFVWDTARGMVAGTDPRLAYNSTAAETNANWVYTDASGFQIVTTDATVNASGGSYIFLAIA